jgi:hypothetical protein
MSTHDTPDRAVVPDGIRLSLAIHPHTMLGSTTGQTVLDGGGRPVGTLSAPQHIDMYFGTVTE